MKYSSPLIHLEGKFESKNYAVSQSPFLQNRSIEFNSEKEDEKLKEIIEKISMIKDRAEEALVIQVLKQVLERNPSIEDFKKVTRVFGPPEKNQQGILKKYTLVYSGVTLGVVILEMLPDSKGRFLFRPDKAFKS